MNYRERRVLVRGTVGGVALWALTAPATPLWAYDPYQSRLDTQYRSLSNSISNAFRVQGSSYTPPTYRSSTSSYSPGSSSSSSRSSAPSYGGSDQWTWKDYSSRPARRIELTASEKREMEYIAKRDAARYARNKPKPVAENEPALVTHYMRAGLDAYSAMREARGEIFRAQKEAAGDGDDSGARTVAQQQAAAKAAVERSQKEDADLAASIAAARTKALAGDRDAMKSWLDLATRGWQKYTASPAAMQQRVEAAEWAAQHDLPGAVALAWSLRLPSNYSKPTEDAAKAKVWGDKLLATGDYEATVSTAELLMQQRPSNFAAAARALQTGYAAKPDGRLAWRLAKVYANGDTTLEPDATRAWEWLERTLSTNVAGDNWYRLGAINDAANNPELVKAHGAELVAALKELAKLPTHAQVARRYLAQILASRDKRYAAANVPLNVPEAVQLARQVIGTPEGWSGNRQWAGRFFWDLELYDLAEEVYEKMEKAGDFGSDRWTIGLFWRDRPDKPNWERAFANFSGAAKDLAHGGYLMADLHFTGNGPRRDPAKAVEWLRWGVKAKQASSMFRLAQALIRGEGVEKNPAEARTLIAQGMKDGWIGEDFKNDARFDLALLDAQEQLQGATPATRFAVMESIEGRMRTLALKDVRRAQITWGRWVLTESINPTPDNVLAATETLRELALQKDAEAMYLLGMGLYTQTQAAQFAGNLEPAAATLRYQESADLLESAYDMKFRPAARGLAVMYKEGLGRPKSVPTAIEWFEKAIAAGDRAVEFLLAELYVLEGPQQNTARGLELLNKGVARDDFRAVNMLGALYLKGIGVPQDAAKAVELFAKAAAAGSWEGARNRFKVVYTGMGVPADPAGATAQFLKDVETMRPRDWFLTGLLFLNDPAGFPFLPKADPAAARPWLEKAAAAKVPGAAEKLKALP